VIPEPGRFVRTKRPEPTPGPGEALIRVRATTICATDMKIFTGRFPGVRYPHVPGHEFAGDVVAVGPGVTAVTPGDRVGVEVHVGCGTCGPCQEGLYTLCERYGDREAGHAHIGFTIDGGLQEMVAVPARALHRLPPHLSYAEGAFTDNVGIALWAVERARIEPGERVVVIGPGAIGLLALQIVRLWAGHTVMVGTRSSRLALATTLGADAVVDVRTADDAVAAVRSALPGGGADAVIEFAGTPDAAWLALQVARRGGRVVLGGATGLGARLEVELSTIVRGHLDVMGALANPRRVSARGLRLMAEGKVRVAPLITDTLPLSRFEEAWHRFFDRPAGEAGAIRIMLIPGEEA
jgi:L-iditol 2-dehydrogenase